MKVSEAQNIELRKALERSNTFLESFLHNEIQNNKAFHAEFEDSPKYRPELKALIKSNKELILGREVVFDASVASIAKAYVGREGYFYTQKDLAYNSHSRRGLEVLENIREGTEYPFAMDWDFEKNMSKGFRKNFAYWVMPLRPFELSPFLRTEGIENEIEQT